MSAVPSILRADSGAGEGLIVEEVRPLAEPPTPEELAAALASLHRPSRRGGR